MYMKRMILAMSMSLAALTVVAQKNAPQTELQLIRSATLIINYAGQKILVDPMFSPKGALGSIAGENSSPMSDLPLPVTTITNDVDVVLVTHTHRDHFDQVAVNTLDKKIDLINQPNDKDYFKKEGFTNAKTIESTLIYKEITIHRTYAQHGTGRVLQNMGEASGYVLQAEGQPTIYIAGDAVWTEDIYRNIQQYQPDYIVINSGGARMPGFEATPIIMDESQVMSLIQESGPARIIAVHMDVIDHCRTTREVLRKEAEIYNLVPGKLLIPEDGETIEL